MRRRVIAIIISAVLVAILVPTLIFVSYFVNVKPFYDVDETKYLIKRSGEEYALYSKDGEILDYDTIYSCYVTDIGTLVEIDAETGDYNIIAAVDTEGLEELGFNKRIMLFPRVVKEKIRSIEMTNDTGNYTFVRYNIEKDKVDDSSDFIIAEAPFALYDQELFATFYSHAAYTLSTRKIDDPIHDELGEFSEYGLVPEMRVDEDGEEYQYTPAYYVLTDTSGQRHKVIIGDELVTGEGYYVQYVELDGETENKRDAVYVLSSAIADTLLQPVESFATPSIVYPMTVSTFFDVDDFTIYKRGSSDAVVGFSFISMADRMNTVNSSALYKFTDGKFDGFTPHHDNMFNTLQNLYQPSFAGVKKLAPTDEDFKKYGLAEVVVDEEGNEKIKFTSEYTISFNFDVTDEAGEVATTVQHIIEISAKDKETGNYYAYSTFYNADTGKYLYSYDMIVEVEGHTFNFLEWNPYEWINDRYMDLNIAFCQKITIDSADGYFAEFTLDNRKSDQSENISSEMIEIYAKDSNGNSISTFSPTTFIDKSGNFWTVTQTNITAANSQGTPVTITDAYYAYNKLGKQVVVIPDYIPCYDGSRVDVYANEVVVTYPNGEKTTYVRYATDLFRRFYSSLSRSGVEDAYVMSAEEEAALIGDPEKLIMTITITDTDGNDKVYKFYSLTSRKAYLTVNGTGGFYVLTNKVNKYVNDAQRFFALEVIDDTAKN